jgi:small multidrug resistance pump
MSHYLLLAAAIVFEVSWAVMLKLSRGFTVGWASALMLVAYFASLFFLTLACERLPLSVAYPVWTGAGAALVALFSLALFGEQLGWGRAIGMLLVTSGAVLLLAFEPNLT